MNGMDAVEAEHDKRDGRSGRRLRVLIAIVVIQAAAIVLLSLAALGTFDERETNVSPGERDYPEANPHPTHNIQVTFFIPATLHPRFYATYVSTVGRDVSPKPRFCHYAVRTGTSTEYSVSQHEFAVTTPLELEYQNDQVESLGYSHSREMKRYLANVAVDRFQAGRCGWNLESVFFVPENNSIEPLTVFRFTHGQAYIDANDAIASWLNFWCTRVAVTPEWPAHEVCVGPRDGLMINAQKIVYGRKDYVPITISKEVKQLSFEFHNVDDPAPPEHYIID